VCPVGAVDRRAVTQLAVDRLGREQQLAAFVGQAQQRMAEGNEALGGWNAGPQRSGPADEPLLQPPLGFVQERVKQARPVAEATEQRTLAHPRLAGQAVHRDRVGPALAQHPLCRAEDRRAVACGVGALGALALDERQFGRTVHERIVWVSAQKWN